MTIWTFTRIDETASAMSPNDPVYSEVNNLIAHAAENGRDETEKMASLESLLCYCTNYHVCQWFADRDVRW